MTRVTTPLGRDHLGANLTALRTTQPRLFERVHWPVQGDHLFQDAEGVWTYRLHESQYPFALEPEALEESLPASVADGDEILLFGLGLGEQLAQLLQRFPSSRVTAWDRDPWVLRQVLSLHDWSEPLASGRLRFELGADLVRHAEAGWKGSVVWHPLLASVYANERLLLQDGLRGRGALVCTGGLFVDSLADALREEGYGVYSFDVQRLAVEELELVLEQVRPELVASINYVNGLAEFCTRHDVDYLCWEVDPATDELQPLAAPAPRAHAFTHRASSVETFRRAGFAHVEHLPLATDPRRRQPIVLDAEERERYGAPVSFVGSSLMRNVEANQRTFLAQVEAWQPGQGQRGRQALAEVAEAQRADFTRYLVPELLEVRLPGLREFCRELGHEDPAMLIAELCGAEKRLNYVVELAEHGVRVWGDEGWSQLETHGVDYRGPAGHERELPRIYSGSTINLDVGRLYQNDIVTMRIFDVLACGGFVLAEHSPALEELFEVGVEVESYRTLEELREKVAHFLAHPDQARTIAERGRAAVLERHRIDARVRRMLASFGAAPGRSAVA